MRRLRDGCRDTSTNCERGEGIRWASSAARSEGARRDLPRSIVKRMGGCADIACVAAHIDFTTRRCFEDQLAARAPEPIPVVEPPLSVGATLAEIPSAATPDVFMVLGAIGIFFWTIVAPEIALPFH